MQISIDFLKKITYLLYMIYITPNSQISHFTAQAGNQVLRDTYNLLFMTRKRLRESQLSFDAGGMRLEKMQYQNDMRFTVTMDFHGNERVELTTGMKPSAIDNAIDEFILYFGSHGYDYSITEVPLTVQFYELPMEAITGFISDPIFEALCIKYSTFFSWNTTLQVLDPEGV